MTLDCGASTAPRIVPALTGIPETLLWTLHSRAREAVRPGGRLRDPEAERIYASIDYDFEDRFGAANPLFALRASLIDTVLVRWLRRHPDGLIVSLGEGLETQAYRVDNGRMRWLSVDLPEVIRLREIFISPTERFAHLGCSATDPAWMHHVDARSPVFIVAQGLFMYLDPGEVKRLLLEIAARFAGADLVFDVVGRDLSEATLRGHQQTETYQLPAMPWGLNRNEVVRTLRAWTVRTTGIRFLPYRVDRRRGEIIETLLDRILPSRQSHASLVHLVF
jgi:O-methyltransferase involved in polyketide biosynthesis